MVDTTFEDQYLSLLADIYNHGTVTNDRTGVGTKSLFGRMMKFDMSNGKFPLLTTKKVFFRGVVEELLWFLRGDPTVKNLQERNVHIWDEWVKDDGTIGPGYPVQWRSWEGADGRVHDQISNVIESIKNNPHSRRHIVNSWNVDKLDDMALPPCHVMFQFNVSGSRLNLALYQRSADTVLGIPFNIASYALLLHMVAAQTGYEVGEFTHFIGDAHIYLNHFTQVRIQYGRVPFDPPAIELNPAVESIFDYTFDDIKLINYQHHPAISAPVAV